MGVQKFVAIIIIIKFADVMSISTLKPNDLGFGISPDYLEERVIVEPEMDLRQKFLRNKESNRKEKEKIQVLDKTIQNTTVYQDGIAHGLISKRNPNGQKIMDIENEFIDIVMMDKVKYIYKRDEYWRTWREVNFNGNKTIVCYRCQNSNSNCSGSWVIEEDTPPCPYELFSVIDKDHLCVANYSQYKTINNLCPQIIKFNDLSAKCNNPIETSWQVNPNYDIKQDRDGYICKRNEICEFSTSYWIYHKDIVFRIVNSENKIIYSRLMKSNKKNYACLNDCGAIDEKTKNVIPVKINTIQNILSKKRKRKRDRKRDINIRPSKTIAEDIKKQINIREFNTRGNNYIRGTNIRYINENAIEDNMIDEHFREKEKAPCDSCSLVNYRHLKDYEDENTGHDNDSI